ncbi:tetratricopeptide repeat protein [Actinomyces bowdenii]|uniref:tetratricopeptide repeat protein n=1 Tax=Actinomyces bowdenii TaxID=131109 RepID=UPI001ABBE7BE|nr:tetratricopeptide repeat protein [Actinomyces bowdenii]MBO3724909.1 tetratricopeptide repeat protein [Actinomyces bowdenii]
MSMFGAVDLSTLAPSTAPGGGAAAPGSRPGGIPGASASGASASGGLPAPLIVDVDATTLRDVAEISTQVPVLLVLHSPRSQAATDLVALLERLARDYGGRFQLGRLDVDAAPEVAQALQAQAVPAVMALLAGQPVPIFQGTAPEEELRSVIDQLLQLAASNGVTGTIAVDGTGQAEPDEEESEVEKAARQAIEAGDYAAAEEVYDRAIKQAPGDDQLKAARSQVRFLARTDGQDPAAALAAADAAPQDLQAALAGADAALALGDANAALVRALEAVRSHTGEERETARLRLLELFDIVGAGSPEVARVRRMLATILY